MLTQTILADTRACTVCLACELACGFRWTRTMDAARSTIRVRRNDASGLAEIELLAGCDACSRDETPYCVAICATHALSLGRKRGAVAAG